MTCSFSLLLLKVFCWDHPICKKYGGEGANEGSVKIKLYHLCIISDPDVTMSSWTRAIGKRNEWIPGNNEAKIGVKVFMRGDRWSSSNLSRRRRRAPPVSWLEAEPLSSHHTCLCAELVVGTYMFHALIVPIYRRHPARTVMTCHPLSGLLAPPPGSLSSTMSHREKIMWYVSIPTCGYRGK